MPTAPTPPPGDPPAEDIVLAGGPWDGKEFEFGTPALQELWYLDRHLVFNELVNDAGARAFDPDAGQLDPDAMFGHIRRNARKMASPTTASVYRRRAGTRVFEFVRSEPGEVFERLDREGHFDGAVCQRGC